MENTNQKCEKIWSFLINLFSSAEFSYSCKTSWAYQSEWSSGQKESKQSQVSDKQSVCVIFINIIVIRNFALLCRVFFFFHQAHRPSSYNGNLNCTSTAAQSWPGSAPAHIRHSSHPASTHPTQEAWCGYWGTPGYRYKELFKLWFSLYVRVKTIVIKAWIYDDCYPANNTIYVELLLVHESLKNFTIIHYIFICCVPIGLVCSLKAFSFYLKSLLVNLQRQNRWWHDSPSHLFMCCSKSFFWLVSVHLVFAPQP